MDTIVAAVIGFVGTTIGGLLTAFGREFLDKFASGRNPYVDILGLWNCEWYVTNSSGDEVLYNSDIVKITELKGWGVEARGYQQTAGEYVLSGRISPVNVLTMLYEGKSKRHSLTGAVVLKVSPLADVMKGKWYGYTREDKLQGGEVIWKRAAAEDSLRASAD
jgi:cell division protein YceG involved in septum cleavage